MQKTTYTNGESSSPPIGLDEKLDEISERIRTDSTLDFNTLADELHEAHKSLRGDETYYKKAESGEALEEAAKDTNRPIDREENEWIDVNSSDYE